MLKQRVITAAVLLPIVLLALFIENVWLWRILVSVFIAVAWWEWVRLAQVQRKTMYIVISTCVLLGLMIMFANEGYIFGVILFSILLWLIAILCCFLMPEKMNQMILPQTKLLFGSWALAFTWWSLVWLREQANGALWVLGFLMIIWLADTGAYFAGKRFGKHKLAPLISPGKTVEGLLGGIICVTIYALIMQTVFNDVFEASGFALVLMAVVIAIISVGGDLFESWMKRHARIKDSSQVLPGHGGVLDRIDSLIAALPFMLGAYAYMTGMQWV